MPTNAMVMNQQLSITFHLSCPGKSIASILSILRRKRTYKTRISKSSVGRGWPGKKAAPLGASYCVRRGADAVGTLTRYGSHKSEQLYDYHPFCHHQLPWIAPSYKLLRVSPLSPTSISAISPPKEPSCMAESNPLIL